MPMFDDREKAADCKFERDREIAFRVTARRNKLLGLWAAEHMGLIGDAAACYALDLMESEFTERSDGAMIRKVCADLMARGFPMTEAEVVNRLAAFGVKARAQVLQNAGS